MNERDGHVRLLPLHVANKIAAGEVVERPASVLKELMENAIDAGATRIEAAATAGGRKSISVRDDGCGMTREDALLSLERQATSKIRDVDDIERIDTLGFRGEAIPSIASVSRFTLSTRRAADEGGTRLIVNAGTLAEVCECGVPPGTCVEVRDLFCNVPARRKFLRAFATEEAHIRTTFTLHALAHPDVGFSLALDGREAYRLAPGATLEERIYDLFGPAFAENLMSVDETTGNVRVYGYVERPGRGAGGVRKDQFVFVNGRPATAPAIGYALREAYPRAQDETRPAMVLFIRLPPEQVDVNVHPAKREVRFRHAANVREAILAAFAKAFAAESPRAAATTDTVAPSASPPQNAYATLPDTAPPAATEPFIPPFTSAPVQTKFVLPPPPPPEAAPCETGTRQATADAEVQPTPPAMPTTSTASTALWRWFRFLAQTESGFFLLETDSGLVTLDPRAARERIVYERLVARTTPVSQSLLLPETVKLPPSDSARIRGFIPELVEMGFEIEEFGHDTWKVDAVPDMAAGISTADLLATIAADVSEAGARRGGTRWRNEIVAKSVARSFAGASSKFTPESAVRLVNELASAKMPYVCPRGKPTMVFTSNRELSRKFGR